MERRHCLVTGANRGLGLEFVRQQLARGDHVVATARHPGRATALNALAGEHPGRLHVLPLDVASEKSRQELAHELPLVLGDAQLDLLVNNAGVLHSGERWGHVDPAILEDSLRTNAMGPFLLAQALASRLRDGGTIANVSSGMGSIASVREFRSPSYCISKAALDMATALLAQSLASRRIVVVALCPGWVRTDMGGTSAPQTPEVSVGGLLRVLDDVTFADSGRFIDWQGAPMPW